MLVLMLKALVLPVHAAGDPGSPPAHGVDAAGVGVEAECPMHAAEQAGDERESCACPDGGCCVISSDRHAHTGFQILSSELELKQTERSARAIVSGSDSPLFSYESRAPPVISLFLNFVRNSSDYQVADLARTAPV